MSQQIVPSRMNLQIYKQKIVAAKKGHQLLKRKADALKAKFRFIMLDLLANKKKMGEQLQACLLMFAQAQYAAGDFHNNVKQAVKRATVRVDKSQQNIAGVMLPQMSIRQIQQSQNAMNQIGIDRGGQSITKCRQKFKQCLNLVITIASLQASFVILDQKIKVTNRRVNALQHVVIPRFQNTYKYIDMELDQMSKQDFYRLKKVLDNKRKLVSLQQNTIKQQSQDLLQDQQQQQEIIF